MNVISFCLYGNEPMYTIGLLKNTELAKEVYPDWNVWVYYADVSNDIIDQCDATMINMKGSELPGMFWRFLPDVERFIVRDTDSRLSMRERVAVDEWIASDKSLHIMRDHPHHKQTIMGGMWGIRAGDYNIEARVCDWCKRDKCWGHMHYSNADQRFLRQVVYPDFLGDTIAHESINSGFPNSVPFPTKMEDYRFVGEIYDENDNRSWQYKEWEKL